MGIKGKQIFDELARVHSDPCPSLQTIYRWILEIQMGSFQFEKKKSPGRPFLTDNAAKVQRVRLLNEEDCRLSYRDIEEQTKIPQNLPGQTLLNDA